MLDLLKSIDTGIFLILNGWNNNVMDFLMFWISEKWIWIPFYLLLLYFLIKDFRYRTFVILIFITILITLSDQLSSTVIKEGIQRLRPCHEPSLSGMVHLVRDHCGGSYGFISSHAANSFALAIFIIKLLKENHRFLKWALLVWAILVSYSRIYLGVHYPSDVLGGIILGISLAYLMYLFYSLLRLNTIKTD